VDVTESAGPGDSTPLYGEPVIVSPNTLAFPEVQDNSFTASASGAGFVSDTTIGTLSFTLAGSLSFLSVDEGGDFGFVGIAGSSGVVGASLNVQVWDSPAKTNLLLSGSSSYSQIFNGPSSETGFWDNSVILDLSVLDAQSVFVVINNNLQAAAGGGATAFIQKKSFVVSDVPEPGSIALFGLGLAAMLVRGRRTR
jgi:hypothetical protein